MRKAKYNTADFVKRARCVHGNRYDYSDTVYKHCMKKVIITCRKHGDFLQVPNSHIDSKAGCPKCAGNWRLTTEEFIKKAKQIHGEKYDYKKAVYKNSHAAMIIGCPIHGEFFQNPTHHIAGKQGCPVCANNIKFTREGFISQAIKVHGDKYDYSRVVYKNCDIGVKIICKKHGEFLQSPYTHIHVKCGCPVCKTPKGELLIASLLEKNNIDYVNQKRFPDCINPKTRSKLKYDFFLPNHNVLVEYNGRQHYEYARFCHRNGNTLESQQHRDNLKKEYAIKNGYKYLVVKYDDKDIEKTLRMAI